MDWFLNGLMVIAIVYAFSMVLGYIAFRLVNRYNHGRRLTKVYYTDKTTMLLTPKNGMNYVFVGLPYFIFAVATLTQRGIRRAYNKQFSGGINHSLGANRFFGIK